MTNLCYRREAYRATMATSFSLEPLRKDRWPERHEDIMDYKDDDDDKKCALLVLLGPETYDLIGDAVPSKPPEKTSSELVQQELQRTARFENDQLRQDIATSIRNLPAASDECVFDIAS